MIYVYCYIAGSMVGLALGYLIFGFTSSIRYWFPTSPLVEGICMIFVEGCLEIDILPYIMAGVYSIIVLIQLLMMQVLIGWANAAKDFENVIV